MCDFADDREWPEWPVESKAGFFGDLQSTAVRLPLQNFLLSSLVEWLLDTLPVAIVP